MMLFGLLGKAKAPVHTTPENAPVVDHQREVGLGRSLHPTRESNQAVDVVELGHLRRPASSHRCHQSYLQWRQAL